ncbi:hypothetical protein [Halpernia sp. GG3]
MKTPDPSTCKFEDDDSATEGEDFVEQPLSLQALHQLPIMSSVQDNEWGISVEKRRSQKTLMTYDFAAGFVGLQQNEI